MGTLHVHFSTLEGHALLIEPGALALSEDGQHLYVVLDGAAAIQRVELPSLALGPRFPSGYDPFYGFEGVWPLAVQPGHPEVIAALLYSPLSSGSPGVVIFDRGVRRPKLLPPPTPPAGPPPAPPPPRP